MVETSPSMAKTGVGLGPRGRATRNGDAVMVDLTGAGPTRTVVRRTPLPSGRAVVGGFLVALAAVVTFWAYTQSTAAPRQLYVVAAHDLVPGQRIGPGDLHAVALDLPNAAVRAQVFGDPAPLVGASVIAPVSAGALVERSDVVGRGGAPGTEEISLAVDASRAVGGTLKVGEYVDVLGTFSSGSSSSTSVIAPHVQVLTFTATGGGSLGGSSSEMIVISVPDSETAQAVADANIAAQITLVRATEQPPGTPATTTPPYQPPGQSGG